jgi:predicted nucleic acid-binding protein
VEKPKVVVDTSVSAKWYLQEDHSDKARLLRDEFVASSRNNSALVNVLRDPLAYFLLVPDAKEKFLRELEKQLKTKRT